MTRLSTFSSLRSLGRIFLAGAVGALAVTAATMVLETGPAAEPELAASLRFDFPPGADPSVPAQMGGNGFETIAAADGWRTGSVSPEDFRFFADTNAVKGGKVTIGIEQFPRTFRAYGIDENTQETRAVYSMVYEGLMMTNPVTLEFLPSLATHWKISPDGRTFYFRIHPDARFSDGHPVTSQDVIATWQLGIDPGIQSISTNSFFKEFDRPVAISRYIVSITARTNGWRNFYYVVGTPILPAHVIGKITGVEYLARYQYAMPPGSGPYMLAYMEAGEPQERVTLQRRADWWGRDLPMSRGQYNFDSVTMEVYDNDSAAIEAFRSGKIDFCSCAFVQNYIDEQGIEELDRGVLLARYIYNDSPTGFSGLAFNTERPPFDDIRVRKAIGMLFDRRRIIGPEEETEYTLTNSIFPNTEFENPRNPRQTFDSAAAARLLAEAGYTTRNKQGFLLRDGQPLEIEMMIYPGQEWISEALHEDLLDAGIWLFDRVLDADSWFSVLKERDYHMALMSWGGLIFPNPETTIHSQLADYPSNNITAFRNAQVDSLIEREKASHDPAERRKFLREIDSIFTASWHYAYSWHSPYQRLIHTNRFGMPEFVLSRIGDWRDALSLWWIDPEKEKRLTQAITDPSIVLEANGRIEERFWQSIREQMPWGDEGVAELKRKPESRAGEYISGPT